MTMRSMTAMQRVAYNLGACGILLLFASGANAAAIVFPNAPLYLTTGVSPNVMLMVDDSGSMQSIIWDTAGPSGNGSDGYDPNTTYPDWSLGAALWAKSSDVILVGTLSQSFLGMSCAFPFVPDLSKTYRLGAFQNANASYTFKCLSLQDPVGSGLTYYSTNYLNYVFNSYGTKNTYTFPLPPPAPKYSTPAIPNDYRMNVARNVTNSIASDKANANLRFCLSTLDLDNGADILFECDLLNTTTKLNNFKNKVNALTSYTWTPLGEALYEITRYFRGMSSFYHNGVNYSSPNVNQYRCQSNYAVFVTDGYPTQDTTFPTTASQEPNLLNPATGTSLPDYDGKSPPANPTTFPGGVPQYSDGFYNNCTALQNCGPTQEGYTLYLDDLALFGFKLNYSPSGKDPAGQPYNDPAFAPRNIKTFTIGLATSNQMMKDAASYGGGKSYSANNQAELTSDLQAALNVVSSQAASSASVSANSGTLSANTLQFQATFQSGAWTGDLLAFAYATATASNCGSNVAVGDTCQVWQASTTNDKLYLSASGAAARNVASYDSSARKGINFSWTSLDSTQQTILNTNPDSPPTLDNLGSLRVSYLRGDPSNEVNGSGGTFRARAHLLGDIIDSNPFYMGPPSNDYSYDDYLTFRNNNIKRTPVVYVGANDGMLHAFQGDITGAGKELFAYIPGAAFGTAASPQLSRLTSTAYSHTYMVDGTVTVADAYWNGGWKSVLVGGLGIGGRGVYALDVTSPTSFTKNNVLWEFTSADNADLGYTLGQPAIVRMANNRWAAVVSSGYNNGNASGQAAVFILFLDHTPGTAWSKGSDYYEILLPNPSGAGLSGSNPNGLATPAVIDRDGNDYADAIYVGDLVGDLWKIDISSATPSQWTVAYNGNPLFVAKDSSGNRQPITERPEVGYNLLPGLSTSNNNLVVYFGTGRYLDKSDPSTKTAQSFYGVFDNNWSSLPTILRGNLQSQIIKNSGSLRAVSSNTINTATQYGFYLDLPDSGERQVTDPLLLDGRIIFTTLIPSTTDPCLSSASGWLMELNAQTGGQIAQQPLLDTNQDGVINSSDSTASGVLSTAGALSTPGIVDLGDGTARVSAGGTAGGQYQILETSAARLGRISWYELSP